MERPSVERTDVLRLVRYPHGAKPFNFVLSQLIDPDGGCPVSTTRNKFTLVAPFTPDASCWLDLEWVNLYEEDGKTCRLARPGYRLPTEAEQTPTATS